MARDYQNRSYLSAKEAANYMGISVSYLHDMVKKRELETEISASGQMRFDLEELKRYEHGNGHLNKKGKTRESGKKARPIKDNTIEINGTGQRMLIKSAMIMEEIPDDSIHLMVTSPPYFNTKMYSKKPIKNDLGNIHDLDEWFEKIFPVWKEVYRVLQPGRKAFINIMNLPIREKGSFRTLNLVGRTIDVCEKIGFVFKRDIVWHKTNAVRAHFGTYPYPGGILINHMHEFILEFNKPEKKGLKKYGHLTKEQKENSRLDKKFWLEIKKSGVWIMKPQPSGDSRNHIAPFPYELPYRLIKAFSFIEETVLDPFAGSGTTLLAAADLKRNGIGYEINPEIAFGAIESLNRKESGLLKWKIQEKRRKAC